MTTIDTPTGPTVDDYQRGLAPNVMALLEHADLRLDARVVGAWVELADTLTGPQARTEREMADLIGMKPHAVRQAIVSLRRAGYLERVWGVPPGGGRPVALFRSGGADEVHGAEL